MFRCLSAYNSTGQLVRRLATVREIAQVAGVTDARGEPDVERVLAVARPFLAEGCSLLRASPDAQTQPLDGETTLDISHEALLRQWTRCREWVEAERESERTWRRVLDEATLWKRGQAGYFPGASLVPIEEWRRRERPTEAWANRYPADDGKPRASFEEATTFLERSRTSVNKRTAVPGIAVLAVLAAGVAFAWYDNRVKLETRINTQVTLLQNSAASQIGRLLDQDELQQQVSTVVQKLRRDFRESPDPAVQRNSALALLRIAPAGDKLESELQHVVAEVLRGRAEDIVVWRDFLKQKPFATQATPDLWQAVEQTQDRPRRLRGAAALAGLDATDDSASNWQKFGNDLAQELIAVSPLELKAWSESLRPVRDKLRETLDQTYTGIRSEQRRPLIEAAVLVLADHWRDDAQQLVNWLVKAETPTEFQPFAAALKQRPAAEVTQLLVSQAGGPWFAEQPINPTAQQQTEVDWKSRWRGPLNAAVCLVQLGQVEPIRALLLPATKGSGPEQVVDPTFQSYLIARFQELGAIDPEALMEQVEQLAAGTADATDDNNTIRQALLLVMGDFDSVRLPVAVRSNLKTKLETLYRSTPDSGVRAAAGWVWQQWQRHNREPDDLRPLNEPGQQTAGWFVNSQKQTYVVLPAPGQFEVGELTRVDNYAPRRTVEIPYSFALATTEVTRGDFLAFLDGADPQQFRLWKKDREALEELRQQRGKEGFDLMLPIDFVSWYAAAAYCNWLSQQDGLHESEWCYLPGRDPEGQDSETEVEYGSGMQLAAGCRTKRGYRLPTEEEWEYACRARATTQFGFGQPKDPRLLARYTWTSQSSDNRTHPVAALRPNRRGLFDLHGNLWEWTMSLENLEQASHEFDQNMTNRIVLSVGNGSRVLRGGSFNGDPGFCRSAFRVDGHPALIGDDLGFRAARACSP